MSTLTTSTPPPATPGPATPLAPAVELSEGMDQPPESAPTNIAYFTPGFEIIPPKELKNINPELLLPSLEDEYIPAEDLGDPADNSGWGSNDVLLAEKAPPILHAVSPHPEFRLSYNGAGGDYGYRDYLVLLTRNDDGSYSFIKTIFTQKELKALASYPLDVSQERLLQDLAPEFATKNPIFFRSRANGPYFVRESIFSDRCFTNLDLPSARMSENLARAVAWALDRKDDSAFCSVLQSGEEAQQEDNDRLQFPFGIDQLLIAFEKIRACKDDGSPEDPYFETLCAAVSLEEMDTVRDKIKDDITDSKNLLENFWDLEFYYALPLAAAGAAGAWFGARWAVHEVAWGFSFFSNPGTTVQQTLYRWRLLEHSIFRFRTEAEYRSLLWRTSRSAARHLWDFTLSVIRGERGNGPWDDPPTPPPSAAAVDTSHFIGAPPPRRIEANEFATLRRSEADTVTASEPAIAAAPPRLESARFVQERVLESSPPELDGIAAAHAGLFTETVGAGLGALGATDAQQSFDAFVTGQADWYWNQGGGKKCLIGAFAGQIAIGVAGGLILAQGVTVPALGAAAF